MSFAGAECSTGRNPLSQFTKHVGEDRSLQRDRVTGQVGGESSNAPGVNMRLTRGVPMASSDTEMMNRIMAQNGATGPVENTFALDEMRREVLRIQHQHQQLQGPSVMSGSTTLADPRWAMEFQTSAQTQQAQAQAQTQQIPVSSAGFSQWGYNPLHMVGSPFQGRMGMGMGMGMPLGMGINSNPIYTEQNGKGKGKVIELEGQDWEKQFESFEAAETTAADPVQTETNDLRRSADRELEQVWTDVQRMRTEERIDLANRDEILRKFYNEDMLAEMDGLNASELFDSYKDGEMKMPWDTDFDEYGATRADAGDYHFEPENKYVENQNIDPFEEGVRILESGGNLSEAALAFEAAVQKDNGHAQAWSFLGAVQAQNEKEDPAIRALERAVALDTNNQAALMNLAVSYINEGYENAAYATLEKWIATKHPDVVNQARGQQPQLADTDQFRLHERVTELFIRAAQLSPEGLSMDADVQVGLGVLFYGKEDYDKAVDCFSAALSVRPDDPLLWNRLGATLANSQRSEEAIEAYYKALELRPSFVRARYNLGVSCINIGCYKEAVQHLLSALEMHRVPILEGNLPDDEILASESTNLLDTLRRVFLAMDRRDLVDKVVPGVDPAVFKDAF
ncbi:uncharacterized protein V1516DRAFT_673687 [Lipomyces oligophaga]|uniref:uncharacterized protein n=1 Tax=Lipomyces oligophaga TaxID=45792 RepID=UPI0034CE65F3